MVDALGGRRRDRALIAVGEAIRPVACGAVVSIPIFGAAMFHDVKVPYVGYLISSADLRQHGWTALLAPITAIVIALAAAVVSDRVFSRARGTRPRSANGPRWQRRISMVCPFAILLAARGPRSLRSGMAMVRWERLHPREIQAGREPIRRVLRAPGGSFSRSAAQG